MTNMKNANPYSLNLRHPTHRILLDQIGRGSTILDVGCNDGYLGEVSDKTNVFYGLDYLLESIDKAKNIYKEALLYDLNDLKDLPWDLQFDLILFADILEHVLNPSRVLTFFTSRYLKTHGRVIISLPNVAYWQVRLNLLFGRFDYEETGIMDRTHLHFYTRKTAQMLVESSGLKIEKIIFSGPSFLGPLLSRVPLLAPLLAINIILLCEKK